MSFRMNNLSRPNGFQMPDIGTVQPVSGYQLPSGGPNVGQPMPQIDAGGPMQLPPMDVATAIACGIPPSQVANPNNSAFGPTQAPTVGGMMDIFNRPPPSMSGSGFVPPQPMTQPQVGQMPSFGAPSMPNTVDQGLGMQQMNYGNPMGGMNNWFSNFTAPRPMPAPAPMMPMKGMFGVR